MWSTLSAIHAGSGLGSSTRSNGRVETRDAKYHFLFDFDAGRSRVERTFPATGRVLVRIDSPEETIFSLAGSGVVERKPPLAGPVVEGQGTFDVRILALISFGEFTIANDDMTCATYDQLRAYLDTFPPPSVCDRGNGVFAITWQMSIPVEDAGSGGANRFNLCKRVTLVDSRNGFVPLRTEIWDGFGATRDIRGELYGVSETAWERFDETLVPVECAYDIVGAQKHAELSLEWTSVGANVDPHPFTIDGLDLPIGTIVVNTRLGPKIVERVIGRPSRAKVPLEPSGAWRWGLTFASVAVLAASVGFILFKTGRSRHAA